MNVVVEMFEGEFYGGVKKFFWRKSNFFLIIWIFLFRFKN
jgi:hypothetical protein